MKNNELWVIEAKMNEGTKSEHWIPAGFFKMGNFTMPYTSTNYREIGKMKLAILKDRYEDWKASDLRITLYKRNSTYRRKNVRNRKDIRG